MANADLLALLKQEREVWNEWRHQNYMWDEGGGDVVDRVPIDLRGANFRGVKLGYRNLSNAILTQADLTKADLCHADLTGAYLGQAKLRHADLSYANLHWTKFIKADLSGADLSMARLVRTDLTRAKLTNCRIYGASVWDIQLDGAKQTQLIITPRSDDEENPTVTVDNLEVAQFVYLLLNNQRIRDVIETIGRKAVLILGRFTAERKVVLDAIRDELRKRDRLPIVFDFDKPASRDLTETVSTLAHIARFIIADITDPRSIPQELQRIIPDLPSVPVLPLLHSSASEYSMFEHFKRYPWVLKTYRYRTIEQAIAFVTGKGMKMVEKKASDMRS